MIDDAMCVSITIHTTQHRKSLMTSGEGVQQCKLDDVSEHEGGVVAWETVGLVAL